MDIQPDGSFCKSFSEFFGEGHIHVKQTAGSGNSTIWQWQVYIAGAQQAPEPESPEYQGHFPDPDSAIHRAKSWMSEYFEKE